MLLLFNSSAPRHLTHGVFWRDSSVFGVRGGEWAYLNPADSDGLSQTEFRNSLPEVQIATVRLWFGLNLKPYNLDGGPWFGFGSQSGGFNRSYLAPSRVSAAEAIDREFGHILSPEMGKLIAAQFPGDWMWKAPPSQLQIGATTSDHELLRSAILAELDRLQPHLEALSSDHGGMGHNSRREDLPVSKEEAQALLRTVNMTRHAIEQAETSAQIARLWAVGQPVLYKFGSWLASRADLLITEAVKSVGQKTGDILVLATAASVLGGAQAINLLLQHLLK